MSFKKRHLLVMLAASAAVVAGCGSSSSSTSGPPPVDVSLTAPSYGAVVGVQSIDVVGSVDPGTAVVRVNDVRARVKKGDFKSRLTLHPGRNRIKIVATADGYKQTTTSISLRYHPGG
jgi:hypothetical protein